MHLDEKHRSALLFRKTFFSLHNRSSNPSPTSKSFFLDTKLRASLTVRATVFVYYCWKCSFRATSTGGGCCYSLNKASGVPATVCKNTPNIKFKLHRTFEKRSSLHRFVNPSRTAQVLSLTIKMRVSLIVRATAFVTYCWIPCFRPTSC